MRSHLYLKEKKALLLLAASYLLLVICCGYYQYRKNTASSLAEVEGTLYTAANLLDDILGIDFHSKYTLETPMEKEGYRNRVKLLNRLVEQLGIEFLYSMAFKDSKVYFVVSNETREDIERGTPSLFYNPYPNPPDTLVKVFRTHETALTSYSNQWGNFRSIFLPRQTPEGLTYVLAADIKAQNVNALLRKNIFISLGFVGLLLLPLAPVFVIFRSMGRRRERDLEHQLNFDSITGLPNRNRLMEDLKQMSMGEISAILFNINDFKAINTLFGSDTGDDLLREIGNLLRGEIPPDARLYRMPSDEFIVLNRQMNTWEAEHLSHTILSRASSASFRKIGKKLSITLSAGLAHHAMDPDHLLSSLNIAKTMARKNQEGFCIYTRSLNQESAYHKNFFWLKALKKALSNDRIIPFFQPIMNNRTGEIKRYEALVRLLDDQGETILPSIFIPLAKQSCLYTHITRRVILKSFEAFAHTPYSVSLNFTTPDLSDPATLDYLLLQTKAFKMEGKVIIELVESEYLFENNAMENTIARLKNNGIQIAVDDFGSGFSNFEYILKIRADYIKIDGSLIQGILESTASAAIVEAIISFAKKLKIEVIAEYVSSRAIQDRVRTMGIEFSQGNHIGKPGPGIE